MIVTTSKPTQQDYELLYWIKYQSVRPYVELLYGWDEELEKQILRANTPWDEVVLVYVDGQMAGYYQEQINPTLLKIPALFFIKNYQSIGVGTEILTRLKSLNRNIVIEVLRINKSAVRFFLKNGFQMEQASYENKFLMKYTYKNEDDFR